MRIMRSFKTSMALVKNFHSRDKQRKARAWLVLSALFFFGGTLLINVNDNFSGTYNSIDRPPSCFPQVDQELGQEVPTLNLQHDSFDSSELWKLLYCCIHSKVIDKKQVLCGRYGCCPLSCYSELAKLAKRVDVTDSSNKAFFVETSTSSSLNYRQACGVESIARLNPNLSVYVLFTSETIDFTAPTSMALLDNYKNVYLRSLYPLGEFFTGTPVEKWYYCSGWNYGPYAVSHLSDALRFSTLYKFGGYYFDLDIIFLRPLPAHFKNFIVFQNDKEIAAGTLHADKGSLFSEMAVGEFVDKYNATAWGLNGPDVVRRTMTRLCRNETLAIEDTCEGVRMLNSDTFYPIPWNFHSSFFTEVNELPDLELSLNGTVIGAHVWNKLSSETPVRKNLHQKQLYANLAYAKCPNVFRVAPDIY